MQILRGGHKKTGAKSKSPQTYAAGLFDHFGLWTFDYLATAACLCATTLVGMNVFCIRGCTNGL
jgi:hypothetical protein